VLQAGRAVGPGVAALVPASDTQPATAQPALSDTRERVKKACFAGVQTGRSAPAGLPRWRACGPGRRRRGERPAPPGAGARRRRRRACTPQRPRPRQTTRQAGSPVTGCQHRQAVRLLAAGAQAGPPTCAARDAAVSYRETRARGQSTTTLRPHCSCLPTWRNITL